MLYKIHYFFLPNCIYCMCSIFHSMEALTEIIALSYFKFALYNV